MVLAVQDLSEKRQNLKQDNTTDPWNSMNRTEIRDYFEFERASVFFTHRALCTY